MTESPAIMRRPYLDAANSARAPDGLTTASITYLLLPNLIFLAGWLRLEFALPLIALLIASLLQFFRRDDVRWSIPYPPNTALLVVAIAFLWASLGGAGHFFQTNPDWVVRDKVLGDLTFSNWPPAYSVVDGVPHILRSAVGFFLPAAVVGKLFGIGSVDIALYTYTAIGCALFFLLLPLPAKPGLMLIFALLLTIFFSGMDYLGILLVTGTTPVFPLRLEWWVPFSYSSLTGQMHWAPNHAVPLWLVATLFYRHWGHRAWPALFMVLLPLTVIWTPFAAAGMLPFLALAAWHWFAGGKNFSDSQITALQVVGAILLTWLTLRLMTIDIAAIPSAPTSQVAPDRSNFILKYLIFILMEFAILALLLVRELRHSRGLFWLASTILAVLPLYQYGPSNDAMLRLSTPCLIMLLLITLDLVQHWASQRSMPPTGWAIGFVLMIGACTPFNEMWRAIAFNRTAPYYGRSMVEQTSNIEHPHYVGRLDRPDLIAVLRTPALVPNAVERQRQGLWVGPPSPKPK